MSAEAEQVNAHRSKINGVGADGLGGIRMDQRSALPRRIVSLFRRGIVAASAHTGNEFF